MITPAKWMGTSLLAISLTSLDTLGHPLHLLQLPTPADSLPPPPMAEPGGPGKHHGPGHPGKHNPAAVIQLKTLTGTVQQLIGNDDSILDGFTLSTGSATTLVKFPPHLGQQVSQVLKPGSTISVMGYAETTPNGETRFKMHQLQSGKTIILDAKPTTTPAVPATPTLTTVTGKIADFRLDHQGRMNGLVLDNKTIVRIPPSSSFQLTNLATKGATVTVQGYPKLLKEGQVQLEKTAVLQAAVLTLNGQQYLVR